jgi:tetratricopeptide (TPR) repeat protein
MGNEEIALRLSAIANTPQDLEWLNKTAYELRFYNPALMLELAKKATEIADFLTDINGIADAMANHGLALDILGNHDEALLILESAHEKYRKAENFYGLSLSAFRIGDSYIRIGETQKALDWFYKSLALSQEHEVAEVEARALHALGTNYLEQEQYSEALQLFTQGLSISEKTTLPALSAVIIRSIGVCHARMANFETALEYLNRSLHKLKSLGAISELSYTMAEVGYVQCKLQRYTEALSTCLAALELAEKSEQRYQIADIQLSIAEIYYQTDAYEKGLKLAHSAISKSIEMENNRLESRGHQIASQLYEALGDWPNALKHFKFYAHISSKQIKEMNRQTLNALETKSQYEKEQKEFYRLRNQELRNANEEIRSANEQLNAALDEIKKTNQQLNDALDQITEQKALLEEKNNKITESIHYAYCIQEAMIPSAQQVSLVFPQSFVLFKPRDIISGDFYWVSHFPSEEGFDVMVAAVVDCTGHGVPGALMSIIGYNLLQYNINEKRIWQPDKILEKLDKGIRRMLRQDSFSGSNDGMDVCLCVFRTIKWGEQKLTELLYSGAKRPLFILRENEIIELKGAPVTVGGNQNCKQYQVRRFEIKSKDRLFLTSDGYFDQFGGGITKKRKFTPRRFKILLQKTANFSLHDQATTLANALTEWQGGFRQIDDITVLGIEW